MIEKNLKLNNWLRAALIAAFWLIIWQLAYWSVGKDLILPSPIDSFAALFSMILTSEFYINVVVTIYRCLAGILLSFALGVILAAISYWSAIFREVMAPLVTILKSTPVMAVIIFAILWLSSSNVPIFSCFLMCFPVVYTNILSGLLHISREYLELATVYKLPLYTCIKHIYIPSISPSIKASLSLATGLSWKTIVAAEVLSAPQYSMGYHLLNSKVYLETDSLFAWIIAIVTLSLIFDKAVNKMLGFLNHHQYSDSKVLKKSALSNAGGLSSTAFSDGKTPPLIEIKNLNKSFAGKSIYSNFNLTFLGGKTTVLMGPSGKGKTTLLRILAGLEDIDSLPLDSGSKSKIKNKYIIGLEPSQSISYLFQEDRLLPWLSVYDNLALVLKSSSKLKEAMDIHKEIMNILELLELAQDKDKLPSQLSGGMCYRVALGRAFLYPSGVLLIDEPFKGLDPDLKARIIASIWNKYTKNRTVVMVTHSQEDAELLADNIVVI